jgi:hypothetical protein
MVFGTRERYPAIEGIRTGRYQFSVTRMATPLFLRFQQFRTAAANPQ